MGPPRELLVKLTPEASFVNLPISEQIGPSSTFDATESESRIATRLPSSEGSVDERRLLWKKPPSDSPSSPSSPEASLLSALVPLLVTAVSSPSCVGRAPVKSLSAQLRYVIVVSSPNSVGTGRLGEGGREGGWSQSARAGERVGW